VIIVVSLHRDFLPSSWGMYAGTRWDWAMFLGTLGFFTTAFMLFVRFLPMISIAEMKALVPHKPGQLTGGRVPAAGAHS
jgi:molybdopterin-containing oxidoreductase family membrane subunit